MQRRVLIHQSRGGRVLGEVLDDLAEPLAVGVLGMLLEIGAAGIEGLGALVGVGAADPSWAHQGVVLAVAGEHRQQHPRHRGLGDRGRCATPATSHAVRLRGERRVVVVLPRLVHAGLTERRASSPSTRTRRSASRSSTCRRSAATKSDAAQPI